MNDDELMDRVRAVFATLEPVPGGVRAAGLAAFGFRDPDAALLELTTELTAAGPATGVRGGRPRAFTFTGTGLAVEVEVTGEGRSLEIVGQLVPPGPAQVRVRCSTGELTCRVDAAGQFAVTGVPAGPVSLLFRLPDAASIVTSWVCL
ncbi:hypothetical protein [Actinomadura craniellae]|uniref:hypothetical protein n=1 Tax=Actinomadura craniellae TaxID=2231787 RepID=UPI0011BFA279|nr:hypothetical protein [Actinomadura craniellae]